MAGMKYVREKVDGAKLKKQTQQEPGKETEKDKETMLSQNHHHDSALFSHLLHHRGNSVFCSKAASVFSSRAKFSLSLMHCCVT